MMEEEKSIRHRAKVTLSTKGIKTWECTVDGQNMGMDKVLEESDTLVKELERRYPFKVGE